MGELRFETRLTPLRFQHLSQIRDFWQEQQDLLPRMVEEEVGGESLGTERVSKDTHDCTSKYQGSGEGREGEKGGRKMIPVYR